jgi:hypothetical protein
MQTGCLRITRHRTKLGARGTQLIDDVTPDVPSGAGDEDAVAFNAADGGRVVRGPGTN